MKNVVRVLIFLMAFQLEVRVRASEELLEQPAQCLKSQELCSLKIGSESFHFEKNGVRLHVNANSTVSRQAVNSWKLIHGSLWVEDGDRVQVDTLYGLITGIRGSFWAIEQADKVLLRNITADLEVSLRDGRSVSVPEGFEVWIGGIGVDGKSTYGMIRPIDMKDHLTLWAQIYPGSKSEFLSAVKELKERWGDVAVKGSEIYQGVVDRRIASAEEKLKQAEERKAKAAAERQRVRELFYQRTFER